MRVLLVRAAPVSHGSPGTESPTIVPPLGLMHMAAYLRQARPGDEVRIIHAGMDLGEPEDMTPAIESFKPDVVGLGGLSIEARGVAALARAVRAARPDVPVVVGGPLASAMPEEVLERIPEADIAAIGEGEETLVDLVSCIAARGDLEDVRGLALRRPDGSITMTRPRSFIENLDDLPPIDWSDIDLEAYNRALRFSELPADPGGRVHMLTSRGCPYGCSYCHRLFGKKVRAMSSRAVVDEMERLVDAYGIRDFAIADDIFNYRRGRVMELCGEIESRELDVRFAFPNGLRGDLLTEEEIDALAAAGNYFTSLAIETVTPRLQKMIGKSLDVDRVFEAAELASNRGILTRAFVMLGFPTETLEEMEDTVSRTIDSGFHMALFFDVTPYPGTELFEIAARNGSAPSIWDGDLLSRRFVNMSEVPDDAFEDLLRRARTSFTSRPGRLDRLRTWIESRGLADHPGIRSMGFWKMVLGIEEGPPAGDVEATAAPLPDLARGTDLAEGWVIGSVDPGRDAHEIQLERAASEPVSLFLSPRDESRQCMIRAGAWNIGIKSEGPMDSLPQGLEEAIRALTRLLERASAMPSGLR